MAATPAVDIDKISGPRSRKGEQTRARIVAAAKKVFEEQGFLEARIADISAAARLSHGSFYHYFDSKEDVFLEVAAAQEVRFRRDSILENALIDGTSGRSVRDGLRVSIRLFLEEYQADARIMGVIEQVSRYHEPVREIRQRRLQEFLHQAEDAIREGLEGIRLMEEQSGAAVAFAAGFRARVLIERGDLEGARAALMSCPQPSPGSDGEAVVRRTTVELLLAEGHHTRALAEAELLRERLGDVDNVAWVPWRSLTAQALDGLERRDEARALLEAELVKARHWGAPGSLARTLRLSSGLEQLHEAVETAAASTARLEHAKALTALGSALRLARRPSDARAPLRDAFEIASHCGAQPLAEHARNELYAAGARPRRQALSGPDSLTPSERRVAELAAAGESNREIARALYVTPKTVEVHLTSVYRKLGIRSRGSLANAL